MKNASFLKASCAVLLAVMVLLGCALPAFAEAEHETPYGRAAIRWEREQDTYTVIMTVPPNSEAVLQLPAGAQVSADVGLQIQDGRSAAFGSGEWRVPFTLPVQKKS